MPGVVGVSPRFKFTNAAGAILPAGLLYTYLAGTTTPTPTWQNEGRTVLNANPVVLDANGEALIWLNPEVTYKWELRTSAGTVISGWPVDNIKGSEPSGLRELLAASTGAALVGSISGGTGAVARTVQSKLRDWISVLDYGAVGDGATDDLAAFNAALLAARTAGVSNVLCPKPATAYRLTAAPTEQTGVSLWYSPPYLTAASQTAKGDQLEAIEVGVPQENYQHAYAGYLQVPMSQATPMRFWALYGASDMPAGATLPAPDAVGAENYDIVGTRGQVRSRSANTRMWGVVGAAQANQAAATDAEMGYAFGGEFDINNNTGRSVTDPVGGPLHLGIQVATGGTQNPLAGLNIARQGASQWLTGIRFDQGSCNAYACYYTFLGPTTAFHFVDDNCTNAVPFASLRNTYPLAFLRHGTVPGAHCGKILSTTSALKFVNGYAATGQANWGSFGTLWSDYSELNDLMGMTNRGALVPRTIASQRMDLGGTTVVGTSFPAGPIANTYGIASHLEFTAAGATTLDNLPSAEVDGTVVYIHRSGAANLTISNSVAGAAGTAMIVLPGGSITVLQHQCVELLYKAGLNIWVRVA